MLEHYGVTEATMGCPVRATMDVVQLGEALGLPVWLDRYASEADWIGVINRVKPHTDFVGRHRVGPLQDDDDRRRQASGRRPGAPGEQSGTATSRWWSRSGARHAPEGRIAFGLGIVENGYDETALVQAFLPDRARGRGARAPAPGQSWMAQLPFEQIDLLIVDEMGKDISGSGMDSNVIGRHGTFFEPPYTSPEGHVHRRRATSTAHTYGNAIGLGSADFATRRLVDKIDWEATYVNGLTACSPAGRKMPAIARLAQEAISVALSCLGLDRVEDARVVRIQNTLRMTEVDVSEASTRRSPSGTTSPTSAIPLP